MLMRRVWELGGALVDVSFGAVGEVQDLDLAERALGLSAEHRLEEDTAVLFEDTMLFDAEFLIDGALHQVVRRWFPGEVQELARLFFEEATDEEHPFPDQSLQGKIEKLLEEGGSPVEAQGVCGAGDEYYVIVMPTGPARQMNISNRTT